MIYDGCMIYDLVYSYISIYFYIICPQHLPDVLPNYRNPCWYEPIDPSYNYSDSFYPKYECMFNPRFVKDFTYLDQSNRQRLKQGKRQRLRCFPAVFLLGVTKSASSNLFWTIVHQMEGFVMGTTKETQFWGRRRYGVTWASCKPKYYGKW